MPNEWLANWSMVFLRASGLLAVFPVFSAPAVPIQLRVALGAMIAFLVSPGLPVSDWAGAGAWSWVARMMGEVGIGLLFGFVCRMLFFALEMAGTLISTEIGLNLPAAFDPVHPGQGTLPGSILNFLATVIWLSLDLHHWMLVGFARSYEVLPVGGAQLTEPLLREVLGWVSRLFVVALQMCAPVLAVSFLISLVFSVLGRAVAQMNVFTESFAVRLFAGLSLFAMAIPLMALQIVNGLHRLPEDFLRVARLLGA